MKAIPFKFLMGKINLRSALVLSFAFHILFVTLLPSMAFNRTTPLKEKSHNKVRITMLKKMDKVKSSKVEKVNLKPKPIKKPQKILRVAKVLPTPVKVAKDLPMAIKIRKPLTHQQPLALNTTHRTVKAKAFVPKKVLLKAVPSRSQFRRSNVEVKVARINPKIKRTPNFEKQVADRPNPKKIALRRNSGARLVSYSSVRPINRMARKLKHSGFQAPVSAIHSNKRATLRRQDISLRHKTPSDSHGIINRNASSKQISVRRQGSNEVRVATLAPRQMTPVKFNEPPKETEVASEAIDQIMNDFYRKVGRQIAFAKIYPDFARKMGYQGKILVAFRIGRDGKILNLSVSKSSGYKILDEAALEAVKEAGPYPSIPNELNKESLKLKIPISYAVR